jgi:hypothetical protein
LGAGKYVEYLDIVGLIIDFMTLTFSCQPQFRLPVQENTSRYFAF